MPSGTHRHLKRLAAPNGWALEKSGGKYAIRPLPGTHSKQLSIPTHYVLTKLLKMAKNPREVDYILKNNLLEVNKKVIKKPKQCVGLFDVVTLKAINKHYRLIFNTERRFELVGITPTEAQFRFSKIIGKAVDGKIPITRTSDGFNFKFVDPSYNVDDTVVIDNAKNEVVSHMPLAVGSSVYIHSGSNRGRVGVIKEISRDIFNKTLLRIMDENETLITTPLPFSIVIGDESGLKVPLNKDNGIKLTEYQKSNLKYQENVSVDDE